MASWNSSRFSVLRAADDGAVRQHQAQRAHCGAEGPVGHRPAVGVDAERGRDPEVVVRLHDGRREADAVERGDDVVPARAGIREECLRRSVGLAPRAVDGDGQAVPAAGSGRPWNAAPHRCDTGRRSAAAAFSSLRSLATSSACSLGCTTQWRNTGVGLRPLASFRMVGSAAPAMLGSAASSATAPPAFIRLRLETVVMRASPNPRRSLRTGAPGILPYLRCSAPMLRSAAVNRRLNAPGSSSCGI